MKKVLMILMCGAFIVSCVSHGKAAQENLTMLKKQFYIGYSLVNESDFNNKLNSLTKVQGSKQSKIIDDYDVTSQELKDTSGKTYVYTTKMSKTYVMHFLIPSEKNKVPCK